MKYWLLKTDADTYSFDDLVRDGGTDWDGVRNYQARNNLRLMMPGDLAFIYHSVTDKAIVGIAEIVSEYFPDPTDIEGKWAAVKIKPLRKLANIITLDQIKLIPQLSELPLIKQSRLSVMPISDEEFELINKLADK